MPDSSLVGNVYTLDLPGSGATHTHGHPCAVVIEFQSDSLVVPAYSEGGTWVTRAVDAAGRLLRCPPAAVAVHLDNATAVDFTRGMAGKPAVWLLTGRARVPNADLKALEPAGTMTPAGLLALADGLLALAAVDAAGFSPNELKRLRRLRRELTAGGK